MTVLSVVSILSLILQCMLWGLLAAFGVWVYRRVPLRSLPWIGIYLLLSLPFVSLLNSLLLQQVIDSKTLPFGWSASMSKGDFILQLRLWSSVISTLIKLAITILLLSDCVFLLAKAGVELDRKAVRQLLFVREFSTPLGLFIVSLAIVSQLLVLALRLS